VVDIALLAAEMANEIGALLGNLGEDRVVCGTGMAFHYPDPALAKLEILDAPAEVKEKTAHKNAARLLQLGV
jgi:hypothetical protein